MGTPPIIFFWLLWASQDKKIMGGHMGVIKCVVRGCALNSLNTKQSRTKTVFRGHRFSTQPQIIGFKAKLTNMGNRVMQVSAIYRSR